VVVLSIAAYASIIGRQASISRALWMYALCVVGHALHRKGHSANVALASAFVLIALSPEWLYDAGFQLSFLSVLAITLTGMPLEREFLEPMLGPSAHAGIASPPDLLPGVPARIGRRFRFRGELLAEAVGDHLRPWAERLTLWAWRSIARGVLAAGSLVVASVSVQLWIEPVLAWYFNRLSWIAALANLVLVPLSSMVLAAGGIGALAASMIPGAEGVMVPAAALSELLVYAARALSGLPGAWMRSPTPPAPWVLCLLAVLAVWFITGWRRRWAPFLLVASLLGILACAPAPGWAVPAAGIPEGWVRQPLSLTFLDVGQGDSAVVRFPDSRIWVVDAGGTQMAGAEGNGPPRFDVGESVVSRYLWHQWVRRLDGLSLSHPHFDHGGGMPALLRNFKVGDLIHGNAGRDPLLGRILAMAQARGVRVSRAAAGRQFEVGGVRLRVLFPPQALDVAPSNNQSLVLQLSVGRFSALLTGDVERAAEGVIVRQYGRTLRSPLLKVAHHGSRTSTTDALLREVRPRWAVISAGCHNPFGEPSREVVLRLARGGALPLLTMDHGAITLETDGEHYVLRSHRNGILDAGSL
jgi:competence protein ComEC